MAPTRIILADHHALFRRGLANLLACEAGLEVVGEADDGVEALTLARRLKPDVVLMEIAMPAMDGVEVMRQIKAEVPGVRVIFLTASDTEQIPLEVLQSGAQHCLFKTIELSALCGAVRNPLV